MLKGRRAWIQFALFLAVAASSSRSSAGFLIPCPPHEDYIFRRCRRRDGAGPAQCPATADKNERLAQRPRQFTVTCTTKLGAAAKRTGGGAGGGGFGSSSSSSTAASKNKKNAGASTAAGKKSILKKLERTYGGTSPQEIAAATQKSIEQTLSNLPTHLQLATKLYQQLRLWNARWDALSILEQANVPMSQVEGAQRAQEELERLQAQHGITDADLHNIFQRVTWDASADAKAARAITGTMPTDILGRIDKACAIVVEAVVGASNSTENGKGRCLDVGCGFGTLVPNLLRIRSSDNQKLQPSQIYGVDLSPAMIRNANELYCDCQFEACDFLQYSGPAVKNSDDDGCFDAILFCSALHDMPDPVVAMRKAMSLLRLNGKLVIVHAQGSGHVNRQAAANPVLVRRGLPDAEELQRILKDMPEGSFVMETEPAKASTAKDMEEGYLAVVQRVQ